jgi:hypothetical protein
MPLKEIDLPAIEAGPPATRSINVVDAKGVSRKIQPQLKSALDKIVWQGMDPFEAAQSVGMNSRSMRKALERPHVLAYLQSQRAAFRASLQASNMHFARDIRENSENDAARVRCLQYIDGDKLHEAPPGRAPTPGVVVHVNVGSRPALVDDTIIEVNPPFGETG